MTSYLIPHTSYLIPHTSYLINEKASVRSKSNPPNKTTQHLPNRNDFFRKSPKLILGQVRQVSSKQQQVL